MISSEGQTSFSRLFPSFFCPTLPIASSPSPFERQIVPLPIHIQTLTPTHPVHMFYRLILWLCACESARDCVRDCLHYAVYLSMPLLCNQLRERTVAGFLTSPVPSRIFGSTVFGRSSPMLNAHIDRLQVEVFLNFMDKCMSQDYLDFVHVNVWVYVCLFCCCCCCLPTSNECTHFRIVAGSRLVRCG